MFRKKNDQKCYTFVALAQTHDKSEKNEKGNPTK